MSKIPFALGLVLVAFASIAHADVLTHKDGRKIEGTITSEKDGKISIKTEFGEFSFARADITAIERGKTRWQEFAEREKAAKSADDFFQLTEWARAKGMTKEAKRCLLRAVAIDPKHELAHRALGHVLYKNEWMTTAERDKRAAQDAVSDQLARGLVEHEGRWVTPDEKEHLVKNEVLVDGKWIPFADAQRQLGLGEFEGRWLPRAEAIARTNAAVVEKFAGITFEKLVTEDALLCGPQPAEELALIAGLMKVGRTWFDTQFQSAPGITLFGDRLAEFYMFDTDVSYIATCEHLAGRAKSGTRDWAEAVKFSHGFMWWDPSPLSSARRFNRHVTELRGHDLHHFGHLLVNRLNYDRRMLPAWFEEGVAAIFEFKSHGNNAVLCQAPKRSSNPKAPSTGGPVRRGAPEPRSAAADRPIVEIDDIALHGGSWQAALSAKIAEVSSFDVIATLEFADMQAADITASMAIVAWIESRGDGALRRFHDVLRRKAPTPPVRVLLAQAARDAVYEEAFQSASGMGAKEADRAWRTWIAKK